MKSALLILLPVGIGAQALYILPSPPSATEASFQIMLVSPAAAKAPVAIQWKLLLPEGVALKSAVAGEVAQSVQKSIKCSPVTAKDKARNEYRCIVVGGQQPLPDGAVAVVRCRLRQGLHEATVRVEEAIGVSRDLKRIDMENAKGTITGQ